MRSDRMAMAAAATLALLTATAAQAQDRKDSRPARADVSTFKATGEPRRCIPLRNTNMTPTSERTIMVRVNANTMFRNDLRGACPALRRDRIIVLRAQANQMCELDVFDVVDPFSTINFGVCALGPFTPVEVPRGTRW